MESIRIQGGIPLGGAIAVHGAKNSALPLLAATLLCHGTAGLEHCPRLSDVGVALEILRHLGCRTQQQEHTVTVDASTPTRAEIPDRLMRQMRSSIVFLGAILARCGEAELTYPGGCELGPRPIDLHLAALRRLGAGIREEHGYIRCQAAGGLRGAEITLAFPSVGATENVLLAACTARGQTVLHHAAQEPEIDDLCGFLNACGARISAPSPGVLQIEGVEALRGAVYPVMPDRIEAATYLAAAAATGGDITLQRCCPAHIAPVLALLEEGGCTVSAREDTVRLIAPTRLRELGSVRTMPYPGFPTDAGAPLLAAACMAAGTSVFVESIFENRYKYVDELTRMGARIRVDGRVAVVEGVPRLQGAAVECTDLRGGAALVIAGLAATGETVVTGLQHLDRGYEELEKTCTALGAQLCRSGE